MEKDCWTIYWNEYSSDTYLYGSEINYTNWRSVRFRNTLMPPGTVIKEWYSMTDYQAQRIEPSLPIITGGSSYRISVDIETKDRMGYLIRLVFYDQYKTEIGDVTLSETEAEFICPVKTYSFKMQLINAGMTEFIYRSVTIEEM